MLQSQRAHPRVSGRERQARHTAVGTILCGFGVLWLPHNQMEQVSIAVKGPGDTGGDEVQQGRSVMVYEKLHSPVTVR